MKTANESLHFSAISLSEANRNATSAMCNKCTVLLIEPSELYMYKRYHSKEQTCCVTLSIFPKDAHLMNVFILLHVADADV